MHSARRRDPVRIAFHEGAPEGYVDLLAARMREADRAEVLSSGGFGPLEALQRSVRASDPRTLRTMLFDGEPGAMFGVAPSDVPRVGIVWLLGSNLVELHRRAFVRHARPQVEALHMAGYDVLVNAISADNPLALRFARWLGADVQEARPFGAARRPHHFFTLTLRKPNV